MSLLAIDPGPTESAWVVMGQYGGSILGHAKYPNEALRKMLRDRAVMGTQVRRVAIEMIASYGMAVGAEVFETCLWVGRFVELCSSLPTRLVYRKEVKMHLCNSMKAKDGNIRQALIDKLGPPGRKKSPGPTFGISGDIWAALGVAVTAMETPWPQLGGT